jgi:hypothetical protein
MIEKKSPPEDLFGGGGFRGHRLVGQQGDPRLWKSPPNRMKRGKSNNGKIEE